MITRKILLSLICCIFTVIACQQVNKSDFPILKGPYFGQPSPDNKLVTFAPGVVSTGLEEGVLTFTPDAKECFWSVSFSGFETILTCRLENGKWTKPEVASFSGKYYDGWPAMQPDGNRMFFHSARPNPDSASGITARYNIWFMDKTEKGWSEPKIVGVPINGSENSTCPSVTKNGTLYISKRFSDDTEKLCRSEYLNEKYQDLEVLPDNINTLKYNFHGYISTDETYLIRPLYGRPDNIGAGWNYYISFRNSDGYWTDLINLGKEINSVYCAGAPSISFDGKYLFFQARVAVKPTLSLDRKYSLPELIDRDIKSSSLGSADIYWIDAKIIEELRP